MVNSQGVVGKSRCQNYEQMFQSEMLDSVLNFLQVEIIVYIIAMTDKIYSEDFLCK